MISYSGDKIVLSRGLPELQTKSIEEFKKEGFKRFCEVTVPKIIQEVYVPALNKYIEASGEYVELVGVKVEPKDPLPIASYCEQESSQECLRETPHCMPWCIYGKFALKSKDTTIDYTAWNEDAQWVELCQIPYLNDYGHIVYDRFDNSTRVFKKHAYNFIQQVELLPCISTTTKKEISIRCGSGKSLVFYLTGNGSLHIKLSKKEHIPFAALIGRIGYNEAFNSSLRKSEYTKIKQKLVNSITYYGITRANESSILLDDGNSSRMDAQRLEDVIVPMFYGDNAVFATEGLRGYLNQYLSLYRAEGCTLAYDVKDAAGSVVVKAGTVLTRAEIDKIYTAEVFVIHVVQDRSTSVYIDNNIVITKIPMGTKNSMFLRRFLPQEIGMYISQDYDLPVEKAVLIPRNSEITEDIWRLLLDVKYNDTIIAKNSKGSEKTYPLYLVREIMSNFFKPTGADNYDEWIYYGPCGKGDTTKFTYGDVLALYSFIPQQLNNLYPDWLPDADACFIKHFTTIDQMFGRALADASRLFFRTYTYYLGDINRNPKRLLKADTTDNATWPMYALFIRKLNEYKCLELVDEKAYVNPMAYESAKHKANVFVGNKHAISDEQRKMALTSYGRWDSYEVPQSGRLGIVHYLTQSCQQSEDGTPIVCYYPVRNGKVHFGEPTWLDAQQEARYVITDIGVLELDSSGNIKNDLNEIVNCRVPSVGAAKSTIEPQRIKDVNFVNADPDCTLGYTCGTIPFSCSNDAIRATFAVAQIKESKAGLNMDTPGVTTTIMEKLERKNNPFCVKAQEDGVLIKAVHTVNATNSIRLDCERLGVSGKANFSYYNWADIGGSESISRLKLIHTPGMPFKKGDVLAVSEFVDELGHIKTGYNACVAYIPDGYNYEDGITISPAFAERTKSLSIHDEEIYTGADAPSFVPDIHRYYKRDDVLMIKKAGHPKPKKHNLTESGYIYKIIKEKRGKLYTLTAKFLTCSNAKVGDKFSDRDGNKGVVTHICKSHENYTLANGFPIDVLRNPLGVATRLNIGQIRECRLGWVWKILGKRIELCNFSHDSEDVDLLMSFVYSLANASSADAAVAPFRGKLSNELIQLGVERFSYAQNWKGVFDEQGACDIYVNGEKRPTKAYASFIHMLKLVQEVSSKVAYRGGEAEGERYMTKTNTPTKGRKASGGQRLGSMEVAAYCAYGAEAWLNEMFKYRSDDGSGRLAFAMDKYYSDNSYYNDTTQRRAITEFLTFMAGLGIDVDCTDGEFINVMEMQRSNSLLYPKLKSLREEKEFAKFNQPRKERPVYGEDEYDTQYCSEEEIHNIPIPAFLTMESIINKTPEAVNYLRFWLPMDEDYDRYVASIKKRGRLD